MKRSVVNYLVDIIIGAAFLVTGVTGVIFLLPRSWVTVSVRGLPTVLGLPPATLLWIHDWCGVALVAGIVLHCALHWRWIVSMSRRVFGREAAKRRSSRPSPAQEGARHEGPRQLPAQEGARHGAPRQLPAQPEAVIYRQSSSSHTAPPHETGRYTRRGFLKGAALLCGGLVAGGLLGRDLTTLEAGHSSSGRAATAARTGQGALRTGDASAQAGETTAQAGETSAQAGGTSAQAGHASAQAGGSNAPNTSTAARVTVDSSTCIGCGRCMNVCPQGVFAWASNGRHAAAADPAACTLCHRCTSACPVSAITVSA